MDRPFEVFLNTPYLFKLFKSSPEPVLLGVLLSTLSNCSSQIYHFLLFQGVKKLNLNGTLSDLHPSKNIYKKTNLTLVLSETFR